MLFTSIGRSPVVSPSATATIARPVTFSAAGGRSTIAKNGGHCWARAWVVEEEDRSFCSNFFDTRRLLSEIMGKENYLIWWYIHVPDENPSLIRY